MAKPGFIQVGIVVGLILLGGLSFAVAAKKPSRPGYENEYFKIRIITRSPNQIAAFYTGRGFPQKALDELRKVCFITIGMGNKSKEKVWLDLKDWSLETKDGDIKRILRPDWRKRWQEIGLEKRFQSTFRWTLMPEKLDFYPHEGEGGNVTIPYTNKPITLKAKIAVGEDKSRVFNVEIENIHCAKD